MWTGLGASTADWLSVSVQLRAVVSRAPTSSRTEPAAPLGTLRAVALKGALGEEKLRLPYSCGEGCGGRVFWSFLIHLYWCPDFIDDEILKPCVIAKKIWNLHRFSEKMQFLCGHTYQAGSLVPLEKPLSLEADLELTASHTSAFFSFFLSPFCTGSAFSGYACVYSCLTQEAHKLPSLLWT